jgi:hypothetical protein
MRPYIICHMLSSVDGKIDGAALDAVTGRSSLPRTPRQDLGPSLSLDEQNPMPSPLIRSASYGGQTVISMAITSSVW